MFLEWFVSLEHRGSDQSFAVSAHGCLRGLVRSLPVDPSRIHVGYLADSYVEGDHELVISHKKAARIYKRAAELGDVDAKWNLACLYKNGEGVKMNEDKAVQLSREAADRGHAVAQLKLGMQTPGHSQTPVSKLKSIPKHWSEAMLMSAFKECGLLTHTYKVSALPMTPA